MRRRAVEIHRAAIEKTLSGLAVEPVLEVHDGVEAIDHDPLGLHRGRRRDRSREKAGIPTCRFVQSRLPGLELCLATIADPLPDDHRGRFLGGLVADCCHRLLLERGCATPRIGGEPPTSV
jgi:hypothetical protein